MYCRKCNSYLQYKVYICSPTMLYNRHHINIANLAIQEVVELTRKYQDMGLSQLYGILLVQGNQYFARLLHSAIPDTQLGHIPKPGRKMALNGHILALNLVNVKLVSNLGPYFPQMDSNSYQLYLL